MNRVKEKLRAGGTVLVFNPNFNSPALVEHAGSLGFDVAFIDCEHGSVDFERAEDMARAARAGGMTSILRPWSTEPGLITRFLDCGVGGVQFPLVDTADAARAAVETVRAARSSQFDETLVTVMIESRQALDNIDSIVAVAGVDAFVIGLADLVRSLGHAGDNEHPDVHAAVDAIIAACVRAGPSPVTTCTIGKRGRGSERKACDGSRCMRARCWRAGRGRCVLCSGRIANARNRFGCRYPGGPSSRMLATYDRVRSSGTRPR